MRSYSIESREIICRQTRCLKTLRFNLLIISTEFLKDQNSFLPFISYTIIQYLACFLITMRQEVKRIDNSEVVNELELAIKRNF